MEHSAQKKSRAKSCTACRQVKLKCNARETYPSPCSRCQNGKYECKMDSSFKRVATRRRVEELTNQLNNVQRALALEQLAEVPVRITDIPHATTRAVSTLSSTPSDQANSIRPFDTIPQFANPDDSSVADILWFDPKMLASAEAYPAFWTLDRVMIEHEVVIDVFQQFNDFYFPHIPIFEPVVSLHELYTSTPTLFWGIIVTASRHHPRHSNIYEQLKEPFQRLHEKAFHKIQRFPELQALLLICYWPLEIMSQSDDPSWMQCGFVINAALHMGLDKFQDEVLFGHRKAKYALKHVSPRNRMMTWMKIFQFSAQLSAWHGLPPPISSASSLRKLALLYDESSIPLETIAMAEIQRQYARLSSIFEETNNEPSLTLVQMFMQDLDDIKRRFSSAWTVPCEINLLGAKLYLLAIPLVSIDEQRLSSLQGSDAATFLHTILQWAHSAALRLTVLILEAVGSRTQNLFCAPFEQGGCPLLAQPKTHFRIAYYACIVLLKYLDCNHSAAPADKEAARNAISSTYQIFTSFQSSPQHLLAAKSLEVLARTIVPNQERMVTNVKTRMGASLLFNAIWTAAKLRGFHHNPQYSDNASLTPLLAPTSATEAPDTNLTLSAQALQTETSMGESQRPAVTESFPWGIWDDGVFDTLGFSWDQPYAEVALDYDFL